jgi:nucleotide-binding universal stress UspA family protein
VAIVRDGTEVAGDHTARIVVGVDGSDTAGDALRWALEAGRLHRAAVEVVHAWTVPYGVGDPFASSAFDLAPIERAAHRTLDAAVDSADTTGLPAPVSRTLAFGTPAAVLLQAADDADLVVVGSRGLGGFKGLVLGSTSHHLAHHATCPLVVLPPAVG